METVLSNQYNSMCQLLEQALEGKPLRLEKESYWIIWISAAEILAQCDWIGIENVLVDIMHDATGSAAESREIYSAVREDKPEYRYIEERYGLSESIDGLGSCWREILAEQNPQKAENLYHFLDIYYRSILPYTYKKVVDYEKTHQLFDDTEHYVNRKKAFDRYKAVVRTCRNNMLIARQIFGLLEETKKNDIKG